MIRFRCQCGRELQADAGKAGVVATCPVCRRTLTVPCRSCDAENRATEAAGGGGVCTGTKSGVIEPPPIAEGVTSPDADNPFALVDASEVGSLSDEDRASIRDEADRAFLLGLVGLPFPVFSPFAIFYGARVLGRIWVSNRRRGGAIDWFVEREKALGGVCLGGLGLLFWPCLGGLAFLCQGV